VAGEPLWRVRVDATAWAEDVSAATPKARHQADRWRLRIQQRGGVLHSELLACRAEDDRGFDLPSCVKTRIPEPLAHDLRRSPWGAVLTVDRDQRGPVLVFLAFGLRHPEAVASSQPSVYQRAHRRLFPSR
jgi:hypothetical protein